MIFDLSNEYEVPKFRERVEALIRSGVLVELKQKKGIRTSQQNKYLHLILGWFACEYGCSLEEVKVDFFKRGVNAETFTKEIENRQGQMIKVLRSSSELSVDEMTLCIERFRNWSAAQGIYLPSANEGDFLNHIMKEMERNKEFL